jgi:hypothetical protein
MQNLNGKDHLAELYFRICTADVDYITVAQNEIKREPLVNNVITGFQKCVRFSRNWIFIKYISIGMLSASDKFIENADATFLENLYLASKSKICLY